MKPRYLIRKCSQNSTREEVCSIQKSSTISENVIILTTASPQDPPEQLKLLIHYSIQQLADENKNDAS